MMGSGSGVGYKMEPMAATPVLATTSPSKSDAPVIATQSMEPTTTTNVEQSINEQAMKE